MDKKPISFLTTNYTLVNLLRKPLINMALLFTYQDPLTQLGALLTVQIIFMCYNIIINPIKQKSMRRF